MSISTPSQLDQWVDDNSDDFESFQEVSDVFQGVLDQLTATNVLLSVGLGILLALILSGYIRH